ncbi:MAG: recombinase family protein [Eubacteriales bacterium]|nr:recombinase family protein [Eubacteriales bacterium]
MSYAEELKQKLQIGSTDIVRAVIYARVSTDNEGQKESCSNQVALAKAYIADHPNIRLITTYIDDGISGKNDFTRPQYNAMLHQLSNDGFDLIITKSLSRLNRDELNSLMLNNLLVDHCATVLTLDDNQIHDFEDLNSGLLHSIKYAMDAQFVKQQSLNGRKVHELRCAQKILSAKDCSYGYDWHRDDKTITVNAEQAAIVRRIFEDYVYRNGTPASIQRTLKEEGINICGRTVSNIIGDERYIGRFYINKRTTKLGTGHTKSKRIKLPMGQWVLCERPDLQIVDTDLFVMAQRIHQTRITIYEKPDKKTTQARFQGIHKYAGKIFCPVCGKPYQFGFADRKKTVPIYRIKSHSDCPNPIRSIYEHDLEEITKKALKQTIDQQEEVCISLEQILTEIVNTAQYNGEELNKLKKQREAKEKQLDNLIDQLSEGGLTEAAKNRIKTRINNITADTDRLAETISNQENKKLDDSYVKAKLSSIRDAIADLRNFTSIDRGRILNYIDRIDMPPNGDIDILLKSGQVIVAKQHSDSDFFNGSSAGKKRTQDARYSSPAAYRWPLLP